VRHWDGWDDLLFGLVCVAGFVVLIIWALK
jgi:hypothetical protein